MSYCLVIFARYNYDGDDLLAVHTNITDAAKHYNALLVKEHGDALILEVVEVGKSGKRLSVTGSNKRDENPLRMTDKRIRDRLDDIGIWMG